MKMKKFIAVLFVVALATGLVTGCGNTKTEAKEKKGFDGTNDITVVSREDGSGTRGAFIELFKVQEEKNGEKVDMTTQEANITNSTSVMMSTVSQNDYAIGYISLGSLNDSVKAVKVDGTEATADNIKNGSYKISRPFNIVTKDSVSEVAKDFIAYIMSTEGQKVVADNGYIPMDQVKPYAGSKPAGKVVVAGSSSVTPVMEKLKEAYTKVNAGASIEIQQSDSTTGVTSTIDGICDIGMASRELKDSESSVKSTAIALDGIAVVVNKTNPINEMTSDQVKGVFTGNMMTWDEVAK
ncbi:MAG: substrate-binding domain-containing protein [Acetivibrio sp.]